MDDQRILFEKALELKKEGKSHNALEVFSQAFDVLIDEAGLYARHKQGFGVTIEALRPMKSTLLEDSKIYLRQNTTAASLLNEMALLFAELGDYENAKQKFEEAIDLIPPDSEYDDPIINLAELSVPVQGEVVEDLDDL